MNNVFFIKLSEDDVLEIILEHYQEKMSSESFATASFLGNPGQNLRLVGVISDLDGVGYKFDFEEIDKSIDFTGDH
jgi:hypothetical protein